METNDTQDEGLKAGDADTMTAPPPPHNPAPAKVLRRPTIDRRLTGVARGIADYTDIDPTIVRVLFVVLAFFGGSGLILYIAGSILIPSEDAGPGKPTFTTFDQLKNDQSPATIIGLIVLGVGAIVLLSELGDSKLILPLLLVSGGLLLLFRNPQTTTEPKTNLAAPPPTSPPAAPPPLPGWVPPQPVPAMAPPAPKPHKAKREKSNLGWLALAALITYFGTAIVLDQSDVLTIDGGRTVAWGLVGLGAVLILSAFLGRARGLIFWGMLLIPAMFIAGADNLHLEINDGEVEQISRIDESTRVLDSGVGEVVYDFTALDLDGEDRTVEIDHGVGHVLVRVPQNIEVVVDASNGVGEIVVSEPDGTLHFAEGPGSDLEITLPAVGDSDGTLTLDIKLGIGQIEVKQ